MKKASPSKFQYSYSDSIASVCILAMKSFMAGLDSEEKKIVVINSIRETIIEDQKE